MDQLGFSLLVHGASLIDVEDFRDQVPPSQLEVLRPQLDGDSHNELVTLVALTISMASLTAFTAWLLRTHQSEEVEHRATVRKPDGTEIDLYVKVKRHSSQAPEAQVLKQIAAALGVSESTILAVSPG